MTRCLTDDGCELEAYDFGGDGDAVLFAHATGFHAHCWLPVIEHLRDVFHCYAFDQRGHGASPSPANRVFDWKRMGTDAEQVAAALGLTRPKVVGHSGGGAHLLLAEADHPGAWEAVWAYEPVIPQFTLPPDANGENPMAAGALKRRAWFESRDAAYANYASKPPFDAFAPEALHAYVDHGFVETPEGGVTLACRVEDEAAMYRNAASGAFEVLPSVQAPVHVVCGGPVTHFPAEQLQVAVDRLPRGELEVMQGLGHFGPFEDPRRVAESIRQVLSG